VQQVGNVVDNLLDRHVWVNELQSENKAVILGDGNAMEAYGVLMRVASEPLKDRTMDPRFTQVQHTLTQYIDYAVAYVDNNVVRRHAQDTVEIVHLSSFHPRSYWIPGSYAPMLSENRESFLWLLKNNDFKEERMTKVRLYAVGTSTTLESNKSLHPLLVSAAEFER
jgi:hypothetical protein